MVSIPLGLGSYENESIPFSAQRCVNLYAGIAQDSSLSPAKLEGSPGIAQFGTSGSGESRGAISMNSVFYYVSGYKLYSVNDLGSVTDLGTISGTERVLMAHNGEKLCVVVPGGLGYVYNATTATLAQITNVNYLTSDSVCFKDGYFVFTQTSSNVWFISALNDPLTFDALDRGTAEQDPGVIIGCHSNYDEVIIFKEDNSEIFQNVGGSGFPFQRIPGASFEKGSHCRYSTIQWEGSFYFLGGGKNEKTSFFERKGGGEPNRISTDAIDNELQKFTRSEIKNAFTFSYSISGGSFVGITIRSSNVNSRTFIYNVTASRFSKNSVWGEQQSGVSENDWRISSVTFAYDKLLVTDKIDGRIGYLDSEVFTEYSNPIFRQKTTPPFYFENFALCFSKLELFVDSGKGLITGQGSDPKIVMQFSDDGTRTWSSEFWRSLGKIGKYKERVVWRRQGRTPRYRIFRFIVSDPVKVTLIKLNAELSSGK